MTADGSYPVQDVPAPDADATGSPVAVQWPPTRSRLNRGVRRVRRTCLFALLAAAAGVVLLLLLHRHGHGRGPAVAAGAMLCSLGGGVALGFGINLIWWTRISRVLDQAPWRRTTVRLRPPGTWGSRRQQDVLYDGDTTGIADEVMFCGDQSPLHRYHGFDVNPAPSPALVAGSGRFRVLTTETGDLLLPVRSPKSPKQEQRWRERWRHHLAESDGSTTPPTGAKPSHH